MSPISSSWDPNPNHIFYGVLIFAWLEFLWQGYLSFRQRKIYRQHKTPPNALSGIIDKDTFEKARLYALDKSVFGAINGLFSQVVSTLIIWFMGFKFLWDSAGYTNQRLGLDPTSEIYRSMTFVGLSNIFSTVIGLPFSIYNTFVLEERHGFNQQTAGFFIKDLFKKFLVAQAITLPLVAATVKIIYWGGDYFFVYLWFFVFTFSIIMMVVYPEFIAPLFDKYTPLPEGNLRTQIEALASSIEFPLYKLFVVDGSKRSSHSNAYFFGFFKFKRIVLFDTLLEESERELLKTEEEKEQEAKESEVSSVKKKLPKTGCSTPEILAVLGHELGHWKLNHVLKNMIIAEVHIFLMFLLFAYLYRLQPLYTAFGFFDEQPILIGLMVVLQFITAPYNAVLEFAMTALSRRFEFQADEFAARVLNRHDDLAAALVKLNNDNLGYPIFDPLYSAWHHSHPPLLERLDAIAVIKEEKKRN